MKWMCIVLLLLAFPLALFADEPAQPAQVTISLTTTVPEILTHGFLSSEGSTNILSTLSVPDAFDAEGATIYYAIQTNVARPFKVYATVSPFELKNANTSAQVAIEKLLVGANEITGSEGEYQIIDFNQSASGMGLVYYTLTIIADQDAIEAVPSGRYESTVMIGIRSD